MALASSVRVIWPVLRFNAWQFLSLWYRLEPGLSETYTLPPAVTSVCKASASALLEEEDNLPIAKPSIKKPIQKVTRPKQKNFFESLSFLSMSLFDNCIVYTILLQLLFPYIPELFRPKPTLLLSLYIWSIFLMYYHRSTLASEQVLKV